MKESRRWAPVRSTEDTWVVEERVYHPSFEALGGTQFCTGNGYMGLRGSFEELGTQGVQGFYIAGVYRRETNRQFCQADTFCRKKYIFSEDLMPTEMDLHILQNLPDPLYVRVHLDGVPFRMWDGHLIDYRRQLDLRTGELRRLVRWDHGGGKITRIEINRFCSMADRRLIAMTYRITPENWSGTVRVESGIDASLNAEYEESLLGDDPAEVRLRSVIQGSGTEVVQSTRHVLLEDGVPSTSVDWAPAAVLRRYTKGVDRQVEKGATLTLEKWCRVRTSMDGDAAAAGAPHAAQERYESALRESQRVWHDLWEQADIGLEGDLETQQGLRYALFHLMIASPRDDHRVSIGAKALTGHGYSGHVFWDTDIHLSPFYQWTFPDWGKGHVRYRFGLIEDARQRAHDEGRRGARYPWQSALQGYEHAPESITCSRTQIHVVPDVAYAVLRYVDITGDEAWFDREGFQVLAECCRYMADRVVFNEMREHYEIRGVGGPDEYHPVTDNNAYTNYLTAYILERCVTLAATRTDQLVTSEELDRWGRVAKQMYLPEDPHTGLIPQCDGFFELKDEWQEAGSTWGGPGAEYHQCKGVKQPDVLLLLALIPERFSFRHRLSNWDYYERFVQHGSSLSPATHALIAARLGLVQKARSYVRLSTQFDFVNYNKDSEQGIHIGNFGGLWQAIVYGFAGLEVHGDTLHCDPHLPLEWKTLRFQLMFKGCRLRVVISSSAVTVEVDEDPAQPIAFCVRGCTYTLEGRRPRVVYSLDHDQDSSGKSGRAGELTEVGVS